MFEAVSGKRLRAYPRNATGGRFLSSRKDLFKTGDRFCAVGSLVVMDTG